MAITSNDLELNLSGGAGNTNPNSSLGGDISSTVITDNSLNNLWDDVSGAEHQSGDTEYRCIFLKNKSSSDTAFAVKLWIESNTTSADDEIFIGLDNAGIGTTASETIANEETAPAGGTVTFSQPTSGSPLDIGNMTAGQSIPVWIKRVVSVGTDPEASNTYQLKVMTDTL